MSARRTGPPVNGLGALSQANIVFIATLKVLSSFKWAEISRDFVQQFPHQGNPTEKDFRSRWCRQLRANSVRRSLEGQRPLAAADHLLAVQFLQRYVPDNKLSESGRAFQAQYGVVNAAPPVPSAAVVPATATVAPAAFPPVVADPTPSTQAASQDPTPVPTASTAQQALPAQDPTPSGDAESSDTEEPVDDGPYSFNPRVFGWVFPAKVSTQVEAQAPEPEPHVEEEPEPYESIYPDPELYELHPTTKREGPTSPGA
ncbi:hypothetical protein FQN54_009415 [Arachnomyces sp. PD_36]|nr:hypothetical protein FQN54_009415 [Arachnomyces sp. PD_36]